MDEARTSRTIAIIGGTGKEGKGLAFRWARAGHRVIIGSRQEGKAQAAAEEVNKLLGTSDQLVVGMSNEQAAQSGDIVVLTVPYAAHREMCEFIKPFVQGKIVVDVTVPLVPPKVTRVQMPPDGSATMEAQRILGEDVQVVAAFQNISYEHLLHDEPIECDVLVCGGNKEAREVVLGLVRDAGLVGWNAGPTENAVVVEGLTSILIGLNKQFGVQSAGIRITGVPRPK
ncbi:NADPH-dependent F420 reductase [uncultured Thermanaerothrix sp.]|uniref:NADPH-dependent F420 reductase n=1 Tax=uncultured Thermanaerothrix sp. TaxID=1195149 RepID=UPI00260A24DA|nr:NADPH-dependent F420 reductase [uncultured Thermanaerothrix sp.]